MVYQLGSDRMITDRRSPSRSIIIDTYSGLCRWMNKKFFYTQYKLKGPVLVLLKACVEYLIWNQPYQLGYLTAVVL